MARILIATEDAALYAVLSAECGGEGHETLWAASGFEALQMTQSEGPDLVFLDLPLAVFTGTEVCSMLREDPTVPKSLPVYLVTDDDLNPHLILRCGATGIFPKTHAANELRELLSVKLLYSDRLALERDALQG
jgi:CheY-like chemotaxis protein